MKNSGFYVEAHFGLYMKALRPELPGRLTAATAATALKPKPTSLGFINRVYQEPPRSPSIEPFMVPKSWYMLVFRVYF